MPLCETIRRLLCPALLALSCALLASPIPATAQQQHGHGAPPGAVGNFGQVHFPTPCSPPAQYWFERAVAMLHSFHFPATERAFKDVAEAEPDCAMALWGVAVSQRLNPLLPPFSITAALFRTSCVAPLCLG